MKRRFEPPRALCVVAIAALSLCGIAAAEDATADAGAKKIKGIAAGSDFLQTGVGSQTTFQNVVVPLKGIPIKGQGNTDTIVMREKDAGTLEFDSPDLTRTIPVKLEALNMAGVVGACTVSITLAPTPASTGRMTITTTSATGGTFSNTLTVHFIAMFTPAAMCPPTTKGKYTFSQKGGTWSTTPQPGAYIVSGPYGNPSVNQHTGLPPGVVDFYIVGDGREEEATNQHVVCAAFAAAGTPCP
jgi:hypothetical protein